MCRGRATKSLLNDIKQNYDSPKSHFPFFLIGQPAPPVSSQWVHSRDLYLKSVEALTKCWCCVRGFILMAVLLPVSNQLSFGLLRSSRHQPRHPSECARALPCQTTTSSLTVACCGGCNASTSAVFACCSVGEAITAGSGKTCFSMVAAAVVNAAEAADREVGSSTFAEDNVVDVTTAGKVTPTSDNGSRRVWSIVDLTLWSPTGAVGVVTVGVREGAAIGAPTTAVEGDRICWNNGAMTLQKGAKAFSALRNLQAISTQRMSRQGYLLSKYAMKPNGRSRWRRARRSAGSSL